MHWGWEEHPRLDDLPDELRESFANAADPDARDVNRYNIVLGTELPDERLQEHAQLFCTCDNCDTSTLTKPREAICCQEVEILNPDGLNTACVTNDDNFDTVCLDVATLNVAAQNRAFDNGEQNFPDRLVNGQHNRELRYQSYRNFVLVYYGRRRLHERLEIPCCVLHAIRRNFPDEENVYAPFEEYNDD